jgi:hypothetical protein
MLRLSKVYYDIHVRAVSKACNLMNLNVLARQMSIVAYSIHVRAVSKSLL